MCKQKDVATLKPCPFGSGLFFKDAKTKQVMARFLFYVERKIQVQKQLILKLCFSLHENFFEKISMTDFFFPFLEKITIAKSRANFPPNGQGYHVQFFASQ